VGAFSGVENAKMWGSSPEMPETGSPLAKGELSAGNARYMHPAANCTCVQCGGGEGHWPLGGEVGIGDKTKLIGLKRGPGPCNSRNLESLPAFFCWGLIA
jgi:hypothetical protein